MRLVQEIRQGRASAIAAFVERMECVPAILAAQNARLGRPLEADELADVVQDTLTAVWRKLDEYGGRAALETWVYRFCFLELMTRIRRRGKAPRPVAEDDALPEPIARREPTQTDFEHLHRGLDRVGPPEADILRLKHFEQMTFEEIGTRLELSPNTAKTRYYRGLAKLREVLGPQAADLPTGEPRS